MPFPTVTVTPMARGDNYDHFQLNALAAMVSERRVRVGLSAFTYANPEGETAVVAQINAIRTALEAAIPYYLNTAVHADGSLEGAFSITYWTKNTVLAAIGAEESGGIYNWTNVPSSGKDASDSALIGDTLSAGVSLYHHWHAELVNVCKKLSHVWVGGSRSDMASRAPGNEVSTVSCAAALAAAATKFAGGSWASASTGIFTIEYSKQEESGGITYYIGEFWRQRGKVSVDLSSWTGTAKVYLLVTPFADGAGGADTGRPVAADSAFHEFAEPSVGSTYTSDLINDVDTAPAAAGTCPVVQVALGWTLYAYGAVVAPEFTYI